MRKKTNVLKRNSGFIIACVFAAGASFFTADMVMSDKLPVLSPDTGATEGGIEAALAPESDPTRVYETDPFTVTAAGNVIKGVETEKQSETQKQTDADGNVIPETDADGNVIPETDADGNVIPETDADGNPVGGQDTDNGSGTAGETGDNGSGSSSSDGQGSSGDNSYDGPSVEIYDPGNGDYSYDDSYDDGSSSGGNSDSGSWDDGSGSGGNGDNGSWNDGSSDSGSGNNGSSDSSAWTPDEVILWGISSRYIDESELYNYSAGQLRLIRNEIFALHGRIFKSQDLADYFSQRSWYVPTYSPEEFDANMFYYLNDYEKANLNVILNYEAALAGN